MILIDKLLKQKVWSWLCGGLIIVLCAMPSKEIPHSLNFYDKTQHFIAFGAWAFLTMYAYSSFIGVAVGGALFGYGIEIMQYLLPVSFHRAYDLADVLADFIGVLLGISLAILFSKIFKKG